MKITALKCTVLGDNIVGRPQGQRSPQDLDGLGEGTPDVPAGGLDFVISVWLLQQSDAHRASANS
jgi:hypothetical protein